MQYFEEIKEDTESLHYIKMSCKECKDIPCPGFERCNTAKMSVLTQVFYGFNIISNKTPMVFFFPMIFLTDKGKNPKIYIEPQKTLNRQNCLKKEQS